MSSSSDELQNLMKAYLNKRKDDLALMQELVRKKDWETLAKKAHNLKGSGAAYGFPLISELGSLLENVALSLSKHENKEGIKQIEKILQDYETFLNKG